MTERLMAAMKTVASMKAPSIADILRRSGFRYEADQIDELVNALERNASGLSPRAGK